MLSSAAHDEEGVATMESSAARPNRANIRQEFYHEVKLTNVKDREAELRGWLSEAYELSGLVPYGFRAWATISKNAVISVFLGVDPDFLALFVLVRIQAG